MPENTKNNQQKNKNEPKEQRRKRQNRHPPGPVEKKVEKEVENQKVMEKPAVVEPPPEFYMNLKRETEEILKITEEANSKYKKKEIQSNWAKYEMPIDSYEDIDAQESVGADFESLIQASLSVGGHFQFKHEKSWDISSGPSPYDKYFNINMDNLCLALSSIPFYERNNIDMSLFSETDIQTMNHRATKYKQKYFNDKKYTTPELEAENKILSSLVQSEEKESKEKVNDTENVKIILENACDNNKDKEIKETKNNKAIIETKNNKEIIETKNNKEIIETKNNKEIIETKNNKEIIENKIVPQEKSICTVKNEILSESEEVVDNNKKDEDDLFENSLKVNEISKDEPKVILEPSPQQEKHVKGIENVPEKVTKNPIIESPEDLEKWLDDFLDG